MPVKETELESLRGQDSRLLVAVTGGIASGKSAVSKMLEELGAPIIDYDVIAREIVEPGKPAWKDIVACFGKQVLKEDGQIDRKKLSHIVFRDTKKRKQLESFTHPRIIEEAARRADEIAGKNPNVMIQVVVPLLIEINIQDRFHKVLVVYVPRETQIERLMKRDGITREAAESILKAQLPIEEKLRYADFVIHNEGTLEQTRRQVEQMWEKLKKETESRNHSQKEERHASSYTQDAPCGLQQGSSLDEGMNAVVIKEVDKIEVLTLMDNYVDLLLESTKVVKRPPKAKGETISTDTLVGEHGLSLLVTVHEGKERRTILFDTGHTGTGVLHNADHLGIDMGQIETIVMSHRHMDHTGSLWPILERLGRPIPLVVHPDAFLPSRYLLLPDGKKLRFPDTLDRKALELAGVKIVESRKPVAVSKGTILVTGEIERATAFEKGLPNAYTELDGEMVKDRIIDDQSLVMHLRGKGLVVISGCAHSGIINTLLYSRKISGVDRVYAVLGGFHLSGPEFEPIIEETIESLKKMNPEIFIPMHCTGWKAVHRFEETFPDAFALNSVGSTVTLSSAPAV